MTTNCTKFNSFVDYLAKGKINLSSDVIKVLLTNTAPNPATQALYADISATELGNGNGYTTGGVAISGLALSNANGVETLSCTQFVLTANTGPLGPFRYVVFYDATATGQPLLGFFDYGQSISMQGAASETFTINNNDVILTIA